MSTVAAGSIYLLQSKGYLPGSRFLHGPLTTKAPKILIGIIAGYTAGQVEQISSLTNYPYI